MRHPILTDITLPMQPKAVLVLLAAAFGTIQGVEARGDFSRSCSNYYIESNNFLRATCRRASGGQVNSALNLNACIGIASTSLVCRAKYVKFDLVACGRYIDGRAQWKLRCKRMCRLLNPHWGLYVVRMPRRQQDRRPR